MVEKDRSRCGPEGRPNGKTQHNKALKAMTPDERKAHCDKWKAKQKKVRLEARERQELKNIEAAANKKDKKKK